jgi:hypothetical protein
VTLRAVPAWDPNSSRLLPLVRTVPSYPAPSSRVRRTSLQSGRAPRLLLNVLLAGEPGREPKLHPMRPARSEPSRASPFLGSEPHAPPEREARAGGAPGKVSGWLASRSATSRRFAAGVQIGGPPPGDRGTTRSTTVLHWLKLRRPCGKATAARVPVCSPSLGLANSGRAVHHIAAASAGAAAMTRLRPVLLPSYSA